jgi:hypothetical protein
MHSFILRTMIAVAVAVGASTAVFIAPSFAAHENGSFNPNVVNVQRADYHWNHHNYQHRDWDRHQHRWHYYD